MAKAAQTYIYQSTMGVNYYESLSPEMRFLTDSVNAAFETDGAISEKYDKQIFRQIIVSSYEIDYAEHSPLQTADISNANNAYTIKPSNFTFNETDINPPAELGRLADASGDKQSTRI
ncbi:MAG TPA: hypothetical protein DCZ91_20780 [Lachnospiraceae bacterium]|nr:hypothetical protein [Lachnospiraceae bacterium]